MTSLTLRSPRFSARGGGAPATRATGDRVLLGIALMVGATLFLTLANVLSKLLVARYPVGEVMMVRSTTALALCSLFVLPRHGWTVFRTAKPGAHLMRGLSQAISQTLTVAALALMPLASVTAIGFSAPLFAALVAILIYRERTDAVRAGTLVLGFVGVLIVTRPGAETLQIGALLALGNAVMYGSVTVAVRGMTKTESAPTLLMWQMSVMAVAHVGMLAFGFRTPLLADAPLFAALGCCHVGAQYLWTQALARAPASAVSPFYYLMLVWSVAFGALLFGEVPSPTLLTGAAVVMGSGLLLVAHEAGLTRRLLRGVASTPVGS